MYFVSVRIKNLQTDDSENYLPGTTRFGSPSKLTPTPNLSGEHSGSVLGRILLGVRLSELG